MRPAFSSTKQAAAFTLILLFVLVSPILAGKRFLPPREQSYAIQGWDNGPFPWLRQQIFVETNDVDIVFAGSSLMMWGIDTPYVQEKLTEKLNHPAVVRSICWGGTGYDGLYFITQDLLSHRKVRMLVFYDEDNVLKNYRNTQSPIWFRFGDNFEALTGLPFNEKAELYFSAIIGLPRNLLALTSPILPMPLVSTEPNYMEKMFHTLNPSKRLGSVSAELSCSPAADGQPFVPFRPYVKIQPEETLIYNTNTASEFQFTNVRLPAWQSHFVSKFAKLAMQYHCKLVMIHLPLLDTARPTRLIERQNWQYFLKCDLNIIGIPPARLFFDLSDEQIYSLYANAGHRNNAFNSHLNRNGQQYFTPLITPAILKLYESATNN